MRWVIAFAMGLLSTTALAEWKHFKSEGGITIGYVVGAARLDTSTDLLLVEYKRLVMPQKSGKMGGMDQFVAGCTPATRELRILLQMRSTVFVNEPDAPRVIDDTSYNPPKEIPLSAKGITDLGAKVCEVMAL